MNSGTAYPFFAGYAYRIPYTDLTPFAKGSCVAHTVSYGAGGDYFKIAYSINSSSNWNVVELEVITTNNILQNTNNIDFTFFPFDSTFK